MDAFQEMRVFAAVVDAGSFVGACQALALSKPSVSRHVADLEARLGVRLLNRTTRRLSLTEEGEIFHVRCKELLDQLAEAEAEITARRGEAEGLMKVTAPQTFGVLYLAPLWASFMARHPKVRVELTLSDRVTDLVDEGFDLGVRIARLPASSLVSRKLASTRMVLCASPGYLARQGCPLTPADLASHAIASYSLLSTGESWAFEGPEGPVVVPVVPRLRSNSGDTCRALALADGAIILQPSFLVGADLHAGTLVELMPAYRSIQFDVFAVYPSRKLVSPKVRLLIDFLVESFRQAPWPAG